ncbi:MAG: carboxypeptidase regulatory-like domain-containing protein [Planctomycetota bacterium]
MKRLGLLALVLALAIVLLVVWTVTRTPEPESAPAQETAQVRDEEKKPVEPALSALETAEKAPDAADRKEVAAEEEKGKGLESWDLEKSLWVEGVVRAPVGCADEAQLEVFATSESVNHNRLASLADSKDSPRALLSRRPVPASGSFRIPFPPDTKTGHVSVRGRYQFTLESVAVDLAAPPPPITLDPQCGAWVTGTVTLPAESPVALADLDGQELRLRTSIESFRGSLSALRELRREAKLAAGAFEFKAVPTESDPSLEIEPERLAAAVMQLEKLAPGRENPIQFSLLRGGTIQGVVRDSAGAPIANAEVVAARPGQWFGFDNREVREGKSGADGSFELQAVTPGKIVLTAGLDGYLESDRKSVDLVDGGSQSGVDLEISRGKSISGTVAWPDGKPAPGVEVKVEFDMAHMVGMGAFNMLRGRDGEAKTDDQGAFVVTGLGEGPFTVTSTAPPPEASPASSGEQADKAKPKRSTWWRTRIDGVSPATSGLELVLKQPAGLAGRVVDETGAAVTKFKIEAGREGKGPLGNIRGEKAEESFEDPEGRFLLTGLVEGTWKLYALAEGFGIPEPVTFDVPRASDAPELVVTIVHAASVSGVVKSPRGELVAGAKVRIGSTGPAWQEMLQGGPDQPVATSEADGTFLLEGLRAGTVGIVGTSESWAKSLPLELSLEPGKRAEGAVIVLREGGSISGEVFGDGGRPAAGMFVQATQMKDFDNQMTFCDSEGKFRIEHLLPGSWQVVAMPSRGGGEEAVSDGEGAAEASMEMFSKMKLAMVTVVDGEETHVVLGAPPKDPVEVHGTVTHAGEPLSGAMLAFVAEGKDALKGMKTASVKKDGTYSLRLDAPGDYSVSVQKVLGGMGQQSTVEFSEKIPEAKEHRLDFVLPTARVSGQVRGPDGEPAKNSRITLQPESAIAIGTMWGGQYHEGVTDSEGRYDIQALRPGTYVIGAGGMTMGGMLGEEDAFGREMRSGVKLSEGEWMKDVDFRLKKSGALEVTVVDADGAPAGDVAVFVREASGKLVDGFSMVTTKADGTARYAGLGPGTYTVSARKELLASADSARVKLDEGGSAEVKVALQPGTMLIVSTVGAESAPVRASVEVTDEDGREVGGMISLAEVMELLGAGGISSTEHKVGPLPQGKYKVKATSSDGKTVSKPVSLTGQAERKLTIRFD